MSKKITALALAALFLAAPGSAMAQDQKQAAPPVNPARQMAAAEAVINQDEVDAYLKAASIFAANKDDQAQAWHKMAEEYLIEGSRVVLYRKIPDAVLSLKKDPTPEQKARLEKIPAEEKPTEAELEIVRQNLPALEKAVAAFFPES